MEIPNPSEAEPVASPGSPPNRAPAVPAAVAANRQTLLLLGVGAGTVLLVSFWLEPGFLSRFDVCLFHRWTGLPCPGCGLTRAVCAISHGELAAAWRYNPFGFLFYASFVATPAWALWKWHNPHRTLLSARGRQRGWRLVLALGCAMILHGAWRILRGGW